MHIQIVKELKNAMLFMAIVVIPMAGFMVAFMCCLFACIEGIILGFAMFFIPMLCFFVTIFGRDEE